jgi:membrane protease YdiL (CAAX protease family)
MREPDGVDSARVLALALLAMGGGLLLVSVGVPPPVAGVLQQAALLAIPLGYARWAGLRASAANGYLPLPLRRVALVLVASLGTLWLLNGLTHIQLEVYRKTGHEREAARQDEEIRVGIERAREKGALPALSLLVLIPPLCEETFFRGLLFRGLIRRFGVGVALASTSVLFAVLHQTPMQKVLMIFLGCYFGALVYLTGSLWASVLAHAVNNLAVLTLMWIYGGMVPEFRAPWWMYLLSALVFGLAMAGLALDRRQRVSDPPSLNR